MEISEYHVDRVVTDITIQPMGWCLLGLIGIVLFVLIFRPFSGSRD